MEEEWRAGEAVCGGSVSLLVGRTQLQVEIDFGEQTYNG